MEENRIKRLKINDENRKTSNFIEFIYITF